VVKPDERLGAEERAVVEERQGPPARGDGLRTLGGPLEATLRGLIDVLLPGVSPDIDLAAFVDANAGVALGRGDRRPGVAPAPRLFVDGLAALAGAGFADRPDAEQREIVRSMRHGDGFADLGRRTAKEFVDRLLEKALAGYLSHPDTWQRIGFGGPAYPDGYAWIGLEEAAARRAHAAGWDRL
jgi:hypothetical protein